MNEDRKKIINTRYLIFFAYLVALCLLLLCRDVFELSIPLYVFLAYFVLGYGYFDFTESIALSVIMPFLNHGLQTNYIVFIATLFYLIKFLKKAKFNKIFYFTVFLCIYEFFHIIYEPFDFGEYFRFIVQFFYLGMLLGDTNLTARIKDKKIILLSFVFFGAYFMLEVLLSTLKYLDFSSLVSSGFRFGTLSAYVQDKPVLYDNENMVALFSIILICVLTCLISNSKKHLILKIALIIYFFVFGLLTESKTFIICFLILIFISILYLTRKNIFKGIGVSLLIAGIGAILLNTILKNEFSNLLLRFQATDLSTGRNDLFEFYNDYIFSDVFRTVFGIGLQDIVLKTGAHNSTHNATQELILCWGLVGLIIMLYLLFTLLNQAKTTSKYKIKFINFYPLFIFLIFIQTIQFIRLSSIFFLLVILYACIISGEQNGEILFDNSRYGRGQPLVLGRRTADTYK